MVERYLGVGLESTFGSEVTAEKYKDVVSETLRLDKRYLFPDTVRSRVVTKKLTGPIMVRGDINMLLATEPDGRFFYWTLGSKSTSQLETGVYQHLITPADTIKSFTARVGVEKFERVIAGCLIDMLTVEAVAGEIASLTLSVIGASESKTSIGSPTFSSRRELNFNEATVKIDDSEVSYVRAFRLRVNNNVTPDRMYALRTSEKMNRIEVGRRVVEGNLDLQFVDSSEYDRFLAGDEFSLNVKFEGETLSSYKHTVEIDLPKIVYTSDTAPLITRREPIRITAPFRAMYDSTAGYDVQVKVINSESSI
ncbi:MAG: phage tail tube protein [Candidatus Bathyarchaeia archaeon]